MSILAIPMKLDEEDDSYVLFVILQQENIDRIKTYDPADIYLDEFPRSFTRLDLKRIHIMYATREEIQEFMDHPEQTPALIRKLARGWTFRPELGDHDGPYISLGPFHSPPQ